MKIINVDKFIQKNKLRQITNSVILDNERFTKNGLFSEEIFGVENTQPYKKTYAYIDLNCQIIIPHMYVLLKQLDGRIDQLIMCEDRFSLKNNLLNKDPDGDLFGIEGFLSIYKKYNYRPSNATRKNRIKIIEKNINTKTFLMSKLLVIPPGNRPITLDKDNNIKFIDGINDLYTRIISLSNKIKNVGNTGDVYNIQLAKMQNLINEYFDYCKSKISKKTGFIRDLLLGKRIDYSGRAVITVNPDIKLTQVVLPFIIGMRIFQPFLLHRILKVLDDEDKEYILEIIKKHKIDQSINIGTLNYFISNVYKHQLELTQEEKNFFIDLLNKIIKETEKVVILKRDPALHRGSLRAYSPIIADQNSIGIHPLICKQHNADFDGDQMAVFLPLTDESQREARELMLNPSNAKTGNKYTYDFSNDFVLGIYQLTRDDIKGKNTKKNPIQFNDKETLLKSNNIYDIGRYNNHITTIGRLIFNNILPEDHTFIDETIDGNKLSDVINEIQHTEDFNDVIDNIKDISKKIVTLYPASFSPDDLELSKESRKELERIRKIEDPFRREEAMKKLKDTVEKEISTKDIYTFLKSKAKGNMSNIAQMMIEKGMVMDIEGNDAGYIKHSMSDGYDAKEYFMGGYGSRKGITDRVLATADFGYLGRQFLYALSSIKVSEKIRDCKTKQYLHIKVEPSMKSRLYHRYYLNDKKKLIKITEENINDIIGTYINLRSPIYCRSKEICPICYGELYKINKSNNVGVTAGLIFGEGPTQSVMKSFHTGGVSKKVALNIIKQILDNNAELNSKFINKIIKERNDLLIAQEPFKIEINLNKFKEQHYVINSENIWMMYPMFTLIHRNKRYYIILDNSCNIYNNTPYQRDKNNIITIEFKPKQKLLQYEIQNADIKMQLSKMKRFVHANLKYDDQLIWFNAFYKVYGPFVKCDLVYFELFGSELFRLKDNPTKYARLNPKNKNIEQVSIKDISYMHSTIKGFMFENAGKSIENGLFRGINNEEEEMDIIEQIALGIS